MLEKSPGNFNVEKLRIILLFEADFNSNNKWIGQAVMRNAEVLNLLAEEHMEAGNTRRRFYNVSTKASSMTCYDKGSAWQHYAPTTQKAAMTGSPYWQQL